jgi:CubicO group peptidase (beta-lactamase class C family)
MPKPSRREFTVALAGVVVLRRGIGTSQVSKGSIKPPDQRFFDELPRLMEITSVPGVAIGVVHGDTPTWQKSVGVADAATKGTITSDTMFPAASLGKPPAAYVALRLVAEGKLDLDRPLKAYVPGHAPADPRGDKVTARHVLSHSTGFRNWRNSAEQPLTPEFEPGARFQYSGEGFYYLQRVIEKVTGDGFDQAMNDRLFQPLGMQSSTYAWRADTDARLVTGHNRGNAVRGQNRDFSVRLFQYAASQGKPLSAFTHEDVVAAMGVLKPSPPALPNFMIPNAAGSLLTTMADYCTFVRRVLSPSGGGIPLDPGMRRQMFSPQTRINTALSWGLGWGLETDDGREYAWHWGDNGNYKNFLLMHLPSRSAVVVFTNGNGGMRVCEAAVTAASGQRHPAFDWL